MSATPEHRIREHLERKGSATEVELHRLLGSFGLRGEPGAAERARVGAALAGAGVAVEPAVELAALEDRLTLELMHPGLLDEPPVVRPAPVRAAPRPLRPESARTTPVTPPDVAEEPFVIPPGIGRTLVLVGSLLLVISLFLPWFRGESAGVVVPEHATGWEWLGVLDLALVIVSGAGALIVAFGRGDAANARLLAGIATAGVAGVVFRIAAPPDRVNGFFVETERRVGPFVALIALALIVCGASLLAPSSPAREGTIPPDGQAAGDAPA